MNRIYIGYDHYDERENFHNGAPNKNCGWLQYNGLYHNINKESFEIVEIDINKYNEFYIFPINVSCSETTLFEKENFFGNYLSEKVIGDLQTSKAFMHINYISEAFRFDELYINRLYKFLLSNNILAKNILISSNNFRLKDDLRKWVNKNNISEEINILALTFEEMNVECDSNYCGFKRVDIKDVTDKRNELRYSCFLSLANSPHRHRLELVDFYEKEKFPDDKILWSALWKNKRIPEKYHWPCSLDDLGFEEIGGLSEWEMDLNKYNQNPDLHSYLEIVTETIYDGSATQISDKPLKPFVNLHPFIYVASPGALKILKSFGYKTFHPFIDESYDDIEDNTERMKKIQSEIKRVCNIDKNKLHDIYYSMMDIMIYNRKHFYSIGDRRITKELTDFILKLGHY